MNTAAEGRFRRFVAVAWIFVLAMGAVVFGAASEHDDRWLVFAVGGVACLWLGWRSHRREERIISLEKRCARLEGLVGVLVETHQADEVHAAVLKEAARGSLSGEAEALRLVRAMRDRPADDVLETLARAQRVAL